MNKPKELAVIGTIHKTESGKIIAKLIQYADGNTYVDIRKYYLKDGEWLPTAKGIAIHTDSVGKLPLVTKKAYRLLDQM